MTVRSRIFTLGLALICLMAVASAQTTPKAPAPVLITSCGQSPGANAMNVLARRAGVEYTLKEDAVASRSSSSPGRASRAWAPPACRSRMS
jgi:hypothetical protein